MKKMILTLGALSLAVVGSAFATNNQSQPEWLKSYLTLQAQPKVYFGELVELDTSSPFALENDCSDFDFNAPLSKSKESSLSPLDPVEVVVDDIINIGSKVWSVVEAGRPVVSVNMPSAYALPKGIFCWTDLETWEAPKSQLVRIVYENMMGMNVVDFSYRLVFTSGGSYRGAGKYLANVTVFPAELNVLWGFTFDVDVVVGQLMNMNTKEDPEAGMELAIQWNVSTVLKDSRVTQNYFIRGTGALDILEEEGNLE